jgi:serine protease
MRSAVGGSGVALLLAGSLLYATVSPGAAPEPSRDSWAGQRTSSLSELPAAQPALGRGRSEAAAPGRVLVRRAPGASVDRLRLAVQRHGGTLAGRVGATDYFVVRVRTDTERLRALSSEAAIAGAEPDHRRRAAAAPDDLLYRAGWNQRAHLGIVRVPQAWTATNPATGVRIGVLDTGVDLDHPDLAPALVGGFDAVEGDGIPDDDEGHGTFVAGVAAAATNNERGIAGVAWGAQVMPVKVLGADGTGTDSDIAEGITWAADHGADVIVLALSGPDDGAVLRSAVAYAQARDVAVVAAAGNEGLEQPQYPAAYPDVLAVSATNASGDVTWYSDRGSWVDVAAPGHDLAGTAMTDRPIERYGLLSGTSGAAAVAAGAAALVRAHEAALDQAQVVERLAATARDAGPRGRDPYYGRGLLDVAAALGAAVQPPLRAPAGDAQEPDGTPDRARAMDDPYFESGTFAPQGDVDWWYLDAPAGGLQFHVETSFTDPYGERSSPDVQVFGSDLRPLTQRLAGSQSVYAEVELASAQRVYLRVANLWGSRGRLSNATPWSYTIKHDSGFGWPAEPPGEGPLWVRDATPADFAEGVTTGVTPTVKFGRPLDAASVTAQTLRLFDGNTDAAVPATVSYSTTTRTATLRPAGPLSNGRPYRLEVAGVRDTSAAEMGDSFVTRFVVGSTPDTTPPDTTLTFALWGGFHQDTGFDFVSSEPGSRFECKDDTVRSYHACDTPEKFAMIPEGTRTYQVRAIDAAGNVDPTPPSRTWTMPPPNDAFAAASALSGSSGKVTGASVMATSESGEPRHAGQGGRSVWYRWTAPAAGWLTVETFGSEFATVLAAYTGTAVNALTEQASSFDYRGTGWSRISFPVTAGATYRIAVDGAQRTYVERGWIELAWRYSTDAPAPEPTPTPTPTTTPTATATPTTTATATPTTTATATPTTTATATPTTTATATPTPPAAAASETSTDSIVSVPLESLAGSVLEPPRLDALPPTSSAPPEIRGPARAGRRLRATTGRWTGAESYSYQWTRCDATGAACRRIHGATDASYLVGGPDAGRRLRVTVTARSAAGAAAAQSRGTPVVRAATGATTIRGTSRDDTLIGTAGPDVILGRHGDDRLSGRGGADHLDGGAGKDVLSGGPGHDMLRGGAGADRVTTSGLDQIRSIEVIARR